MPGNCNVILKIEDQEVPIYIHKTQEMDLKVHDYLQQEVDKGQPLYENTKHEKWTAEA
jgi:hypothetical protein